MNELDFRPEVLSQEYVKEHGVRYDESVFYNWDGETSPLYDRDPEQGGKLFTGLIYDQYEDSDMISWYEYYTDGYGDGPYVCFYDTGELASYCIMKGYGFVGRLYKWHRNGKLKEYLERNELGRYIRVMHWDADGNITYLSENGSCTINREY